MPHRPSEQLLHVTTPNYCACALWRNDGQGWYCTTQVAPILNWMRNKTPKAVARYLRARGYQYFWSEVTLEP